MTYRKSWKKNLDAIKYCSDRCRKNKKEDPFEFEILKLLDSRGLNKTICPSEILPVKDKSNKDMMELVRKSARKLVAKGEIFILQKGQIVDPSTAKGPIRLKRINKLKT